MLSPLTKDYWGIFFVYWTDGTRFLSFVFSVLWTVLSIMYIQHDYHAWFFLPWGFLAVAARSGKWNSEWKYAKERYYYLKEIDDERN